MDIRIGELLERCGDRAASEPSGIRTRYGGTTLTLRDDHGQETGSLVVQLLDPTARADETAAGSTCQELPTTPVLEPIESGDTVLDSLRQVVDKIKLAANSAGGETAAVRVAPSTQGTQDHANFPEQSLPYAIIALQTMESAFEVMATSSICKITGTNDLGWSR